MGDRDNITVSGNQNSNINIKNVNSMLTNAHEAVDAMADKGQAEREDLQALITQLQQALESIPGNLKDEAEAVAASAQMLVENAKAQTPNKPLLQISGEGLKKAAEGLAGVAPTLVNIATQIVTAVMRMKGMA